MNIVTALRRLAPADGPLLQRVRLAALADSPLALSATYESESVSDAEAPRIDAEQRHLPSRLGGERLAPHGRGVESCLVRVGRGHRVGAVGGDVDEVGQTSERGDAAVADTVADAADPFPWRVGCAHG